MHEPTSPAAYCSYGTKHVEVHPVEALDLEDGVIIKDISDTARYGHGWAPVGRAASRPPDRSKRFVYRTGVLATVSAPTGVRSPKPATEHARRDGRSPASTGCMCQR